MGVTILDLEDFEIGRVVISKKGKDKGTFYVIIGKDALNNRVYVADGKHRSITRPKPKNLNIFRLPIGTYAN